MLGETQSKVPTPISGDKQSYRAAFDALFAWIVAENFRGYDPYDGCNTRYAVLRRSRHVRLLLTYGNKFSPVNLRPLLGVEKRDNYCGLSLINRALAAVLPPASARPYLDKNLETIRAASLAHKYGEHCWNGNGLYIQSRADYQTPDVPGVIGTIFCANAFLDYYRRFGGDDAREIVLSARRFLLQTLLTEHEGKPFFRYKPISPMHELTFNASIKAAVFVAEVGAEFGLADADATMERCVEHVLSYQRPDGAWLMGVDLRNGRQKPQIDFHQGFILDAIRSWMRLRGESPRHRDAYARGLDFYRRQFRPDGGSYYRYPRAYPSNIHDQAQGIITFTLAGARSEARRIADWTMANMRSERGYFYYLKYRWFTNRIPYIRWGQAWMLYAFSQILLTDGD